ncbi:MAG: hypothetical protein ACEY29_00130 [Arsenophonus sp.]
MSYQLVHYLITKKHTQQLCEIFFYKAVAFAGTLVLIKKQSS